MRKMRRIADRRENGEDIYIYIYKEYGNDEE